MDLTVGDGQAGIARVSGSDDDKIAFTVAEFGKVIREHGFAVVETDALDRSWNHRVVGVGVNHVDADFAERGQSMAAWYENEVEPHRIAACGVDYLSIEVSR